MLSRSAKETFYKLAGPFMRVNAILYKNFRSPKPEQQVKVHLGTGTKEVHAGMDQYRCEHVQWKV
jgi:hypothetical protein